MIPSDENLAALRELLVAIGYREVDSRQKVQRFYDPEVPTMSDVVSVFRKGGRGARLQEIFVNTDPGPEGPGGEGYQRIAIILSVQEGKRQWVELYEVEQVVEHFRYEIRGLRISRVLS